VRSVGRKAGRVVGGGETPFLLLEFGFGLEGEGREHVQEFGERGPRRHSPKALQNLSMFSSARSSGAAAPQQKRRSEHGVRSWAFIRLTT
jgi:hypothetical protein